MIFHDLSMTLTTISMTLKTNNIGHMTIPNIIAIIKLLNFHSVEWYIVNKNK